MIKIKFVDFWPDFVQTDNFFINLLRERWEVELSDTPDFVICSLFGNKHTQYNCVKILFLGENQRPNFSLYDYAFGYDFIHDDRYMRLPLYNIYGSMDKLLTKPTFQEILLQERKFCGFVYSNHSAWERLQFFDKLNEYKKVDAGGSCRNNIGRILNSDEKIDWCRHYKFYIAFENGCYPGYTTEKLYQAMEANTIPIYWGNPLISRDFNTQSFINVHDFINYDDAIRYIIKVDNDLDLYRNIYESPYLPYNSLTDYVKHQNFLDQFQKIFDRGQCRKIK